MQNNPEFQEFNQPNNGKDEGNQDRDDLFIGRGTRTAKNTILENHFFEDANNHFGREI